MPRARGWTRISDELQEKISATVETNNALIMKLSKKLQEFMDLLENTAGMGLPEKILELTAQSNAVLLQVKPAP